jgi:hypothetical protein
MSWKEQAKSQFAERRKPETLIAIRVPQWDCPKEGPCVIYYWPDMTLAERREIFAYVKQKGEEITYDMEAMAIMLLVRARKKDGSRFFNKVERLELMNEYNPDDLTEIVSAMGTLVPSIEDAEKN